MEPESPDQRLFPWTMLGGGAAIVVGAFLPWATMTAPFVGTLTKAGIRRSRRVRSKESIRRSIFKVGTLAARQPTTSSEVRLRIFGGPAAGNVIAVPRPERPSIVLGTYERHVVKCMKQNICRGAVVYDIGAHVGYLSLVAARFVGSHGSVLSVEANPSLEVLLRENLHRNGATMARTLNAAVSDRVGDVSFATFQGYSTVGHIARLGTPSDAFITNVRGVSIDSLVGSGERPPTFIKIDVEGAELAVLRGATSTLDTYHPSVVVEVRRGSTLEQVELLMTTYGYSSRALKGGLGHAAYGVMDVFFSVA